jgi:hypothetical protein
VVQIPSSRVRVRRQEYHDASKLTSMEFRQIFVMNDGELVTHFLSWRASATMLLLKSLIAVLLGNENG